MRHDDPDFYDSHSDHIHSDEGKYVICVQCDKLTQLISIDVGIGPYEFWGSPGVDTQYVLATECCEGDSWRDEDDHEDDLDRGSDLENLSE